MSVKTKNIFYKNDSESFILKDENTQFSSIYKNDLTIYDWLQPESNNSIFCPIKMSIYKPSYTSQRGTSDYIIDSSILVNLA